MNAESRKSADTLLLSDGDGSLPNSLGKYRLLEVVGQGAIGVVYKAFDPDLERLVAIKSLYPALAHCSLNASSPSDPNRDSTIVRMRQEVKIVGRLAHSGIVTVFDYGESEGVPYFVMEYVEGRNLQQALAQGELFSWERSVEIALELLDALIYAHQSGVIHRDIKPANVFLLPSGRVKLADFGIARHLESEVTLTGTVMGTPSYRSPEQCQGRMADERSDLFSVGALLYELVTGVGAFSEKVAVEGVHKALHHEPVCAQKRCPTWPKSCDEVLRCALSKQPQARFASAAQFRTALFDATQGSADHLSVKAKKKRATQDRHERRRPHRHQIGVLCGLVAVMLVASFFWWERIVVSEPVISYSAQEQDSTVKVAKLLQVANAHEKVGRFIKPPGSNAYDAYHLVLDIEANQLEAKAGLERIEKVLRARLALLRSYGRHAEAEKYYKALIPLFPSFSSMAERKAKALAIE